MSPRTLDFYAVLQVAPDAEREVIEAAYRQLMRKYHPDLAGDDAVMAARLNERAKAINQAYAVLRDEGQRRNYDRMRNHGARSAPPQPGSVRRGASPPTPSPRPARGSKPEWVETSGEPPQPPVQPEVEVTVASPESALWSTLGALLRPLAATYFLLPGPYEWEPAGRREFVSMGLIPPLGVVAWLATTGRLTAALGQSPYAVLAVWIVVGLILLVTQGSALPRIAVAGGAVLVLMSGVLESGVRATGFPLWLAWGVLVGLSVVFAARHFLFGMLPTLGICWLISRYA
jgi:DnaJ domain